MFIYDDGLSPGEVLSAYENIDRNKGDLQLQRQHYVLNTSKRD